ncbi:MAG: hypothetical protein EOP56_07815 [Sphingobacteriales bacterium]|nr:MAG: hypothetical protein EOP56_07815 [Sphingobacteriales bacterium]
MLYKRVYAGVILASFLLLVLLLVSHRLWLLSLEGLANRDFYEQMEYYHSILYVPVIICCTGFALLFILSSYNVLARPEHVSVLVSSLMLFISFVFWIVLVIAMVMGWGIFA